MVLTVARLFIRERPRTTCGALLTPSRSDSNPCSIDNHQGVSQVMFRHLAEQTREGLLRFLYGRGPNSKPNDTPVFAHRERTLIGEILIERDDERLMLLRPIKHVLIRFSGQPYLGGMTHNPGRMKIANPGADGRGNILIKQHKKGIRHEE